MYGGKHVAESDTVFVFVSEKEGRQVATLQNERGAVLSLRGARIGFKVSLAAIARRRRHDAEHAVIRPMDDLPDSRQRASPLPDTSASPFIL